VHVDSGIQFSNHRMMMELPLQNEPRWYLDFIYGHIVPIFTV
jgi:hypothetical protein